MEQEFKHKIKNKNGLLKDGYKETPFFQPKLTVNPPNVVYEQEADAIADKVVIMPSNEHSFFSPTPHSLVTAQRKCEG